MTDEASAQEGLGLSDLILLHADAMNTQLCTGMTYGREHAARDMQVLFKAYDAALVNPDAKIPTMLHLSIEALRKKYG